MKNSELQGFMPLIRPKYLEFFGNTENDFSLKESGDWFVYPEIMQSFKYEFDNCVPLNYGRTWSGMREKYFGGKAYVYPDEMITKIDEFDDKECAAFLSYCSMYKERFYTGAFGDYSEDGYVGRVLMKLAEIISPDELRCRDLIAAEFGEDEGARELLKTWTDDGETYQTMYESLRSFY